MSTVDDLTPPQLPTLLLLFAQIDQKMKLSAGWKCVTHALHPALAIVSLFLFFEISANGKKRCWRYLLLRSLLCCLSVCLPVFSRVCVFDYVNQWTGHVRTGWSRKEEARKSKRPNKSNLLLRCLMSSSANVLARPWWCWWAWIIK